MGLMALNLATLNVRGLRDSSKCARLLDELKTLGVDIAAVQETHCTFGADSRVLECDFNVFSAYGSRVSVGVSLLIGRSLDADVDVVFAVRLWKRTRLRVKKCEGSPIGISILSRPRMGECCDRVARCVMLFGRTFGIALPAVLISRFGSFIAILPTFPASGGWNG